MAAGGSAWFGNYIQAGVDAIEMDLNNSGTTDLSLRLSFKRDGAVSLVPVVVPAGSGCLRVSFLVTPAAMTNNGAALFNVTEFHFVHSAQFSTFLGELIVATVGIDNVSAVAEPSKQAPLLSGLAMLRWNIELCCV